MFWETCFFLMVWRWWIDDASFLSLFSIFLFSGREEGKELETRKDAIQSVSRCIAILVIMTRRINRPLHKVCRDTRSSGGQPLNRTIPRAFRTFLIPVALT